MPDEIDRFRKMVEDSQDWFWEFDENADFTYVSPRIRDLLGYEPEELIGRNAFDLMTADEATRGGVQRPRALVRGGRGERSPARTLAPPRAPGVPPRAPRHRA